MTVSIELQLRFIPKTNLQSIGSPSHHHHRRSIQCYPLAPKKRFKPEISRNSTKPTKEMQLETTSVPTSLFAASNEESISYESSEEANKASIELCNLDSFVSFVCKYACIVVVSCIIRVLLLQKTEKSVATVEICK